MKKPPVRKLLSSGDGSIKLYAKPYCQTGPRRHKLEVVRDLHQLKKLSQGPVRRPAGLNSPATWSSAGFVMREIQTCLHKSEGGTKQRLTKGADNSAPVCFPNCASICLGSRVSFDLPLALSLERRWLACTVNAARR